VFADDLSGRYRRPLRSQRCRAHARCQPAKPVNLTRERPGDLLLEDREIIREAKRGLPAQTEDDPRALLFEERKFAAVDPQLAQHLVEKISLRLKIEPKNFEDGVLERFKLYSWPGNVRELENVIERAATLGRGPAVQPSDLPPHLAGGTNPLERALAKAHEVARVGMTTLELDRIVHDTYTSAGGQGLFKWYPTYEPGKGFPGNTCISVNDEVVHGIPGDRALKEGDIVSVDCGIRLGGYCGDSATTVAIVPMLRHHLPEEDAFHHAAVPVAGDVNIGLVLYPYASNFDEFDPLLYEPGVTVVPVREAGPLDGFDALVLPGSKNTAASLRYLRGNGLDRELGRAASAGVPIVGVCGGMQLLGRRIEDPHGLEGGDLDGLGLLDVTTTLVADKTTRQVEVLSGGRSLLGYEIHHGRTTAGPLAREHLPGGLGWEQGAVRGIEVCSGKVLMGLMRGIDRNISVTPVETVEAAQAAVA